jgi:hypothetical protein
MIPAIRNWTRDEMMKRVAFFRDLKGSKVVQNRRMAND